MAEDDYFARIELEKKARLAADMKARKQAEELAQRKELHWNKCGKCGAELVMRTYKGVEIDVCAECGAVLLDRGELETLSGKDHSGIFQGLSDLFSTKKGT